MTTRINDIRVDLKSQGNKVMSSVWCMFAHKLTTKSRRNQNWQKVVRATADILHQFHFQDRSRSPGRLTPWPKILATLTCAMTSKLKALGGCSSHHLQSAQGVCILWRPKHRQHNAQLVLPLLSVCQQDNSQSCRRILMNSLEEWNMWLATNGYILVLIRIMMRIQKFLKDFLPVRDTGNCIRIMLLTREFIDELLWNFWRSEHLNSNNHSIFVPIWKRPAPGILVRNLYHYGIEEIEWILQDQSP